MKVDVNWGERNKNAKYQVLGKNIDDARRFLNSRSEWASFEGYVTDSSGKIIVDANGIARKVRLSPKYRILMPTWSAYSGQPQNAKDKWDAMWKALKKHEEGHLLIFKQGLQKLITELESGSNMSAAEVEKLIRDTETKLQQDSDQYDKKTDHGRNTGVEL